MFWEEDEDKSIPYEIPDDVVDISFAIKCKKLHLDHAWELSEAIQAELPWAKDEKQLGIHHIHVAETGNGWLRPEDTEEAFLWPSRRTRFYLRVPKSRVDDVQTLSGKTLSIKGNTVKLGDSSKIKELTNASVLFSRHIISSENEDEDQFLTRMHEEIFDITGVKVRKLICGKSSVIHTPNGELPARHLMVADLESVPSVTIQQNGLGAGRLLGCGLFLPHKGIKSLHSTE
ncbi:MAG: type I-MYXAN CRISPR-associated protein Cas6/Cmx6 [Thiotrichaceae bacterium]